MIAPPARSCRVDRRTDPTPGGISLLKTLFAERWKGTVRNEPFTLRAGSRSVTGLYRDRNEDRCLADVKRGLFLVTDGVGGHWGGEEASEIVVRVLPEWLAKTMKCSWCDVDIIESAVADAVEAARNKMIAAADIDPDLGKMAATMAFAVVGDRTLYVTRVGDCRAYMLHHGRLQRLTTDQTFVQAAINAGVLTDDAAHGHPWRHVVTNTMGVKPLDEAIEVDEFHLSAGDRLLLCSDGLTDVVTDDEIEQFLALGCSPQAIASALVDAALEHDSHDNVTCVVVDLAKTED